RSSAGQEFAQPGFHDRVRIVGSAEYLSRRKVVHEVPQVTRLVYEAVVVETLRVILRRLRHGAVEAARDVPALRQPMRQRHHRTAPGGEADAELRLNVLPP